MNKSTQRSAASIRARLSNIAHERGMEFEFLLNRFGAEQFLARLAVSPFSDRVIFKGGSLMAYLVDSTRPTKDLDFSIRRVSNKIEDALEIMRTILAIPMDDQLVWEPPTGTPLAHPRMEQPGVRIKGIFKLDTARGRLQIDLAIGDIVDAKKITLKRIRYRGEPLIGPDFKILAYPPETIFSEKLQIAIQRAEGNTRMKDYYDLWKLSHVETLDSGLIKRNIEKTFAHRKTEHKVEIDFNEEAMKRLGAYWAGFIRKAKITDAPENLIDVIKTINKKLKSVYKND